MDLRLIAQKRQRKSYTETSLMSACNIITSSLHHQHDPEDDDTCSPGGSRGNYVMYAFANSGSQSNNDEFSLCSRKQMQTVIAGRAQDGGWGLDQTDSA